MAEMESADDRESGDRQVSSRPFPQPYQLTSLSARTPHEGEDVEPVGSATCALSGVDRGLAAAAAAEKAAARHNCTMYM